MADHLVTVVDVTRHGSEVLTLTYRTADGQVAERLIYREDESGLTIIEEGKPSALPPTGQRGAELLGGAHHMASSPDPKPYDADVEYRARVPFMSVGALVGGAGGVFVGIQVVLGFGLGLIAFAIFGVAVVAFLALVGGTIGVAAGAIIYSLIAKVLGH